MLDKKNNDQSAKNRDDELKKILREKLKNQLESKNYKINTLVEKTKINRQKISSFVNGKTLPGLLDAIKICRELDLDVNYLFYPDAIGTKHQPHPFLSTCKYLESSIKLGIVQLFENRKKAIDYFCKHYLMKRIDWIKIVTSSGRGLLENDRFKKAFNHQFNEYNLNTSSVKIIQTMPVFAYQRELFEPRDIGKECGSYIKNSHRHFTDHFNIPKGNIRLFPGIVSTMSIITPSALLICHYASGGLGLEAFAMIVEKEDHEDERSDEESKRLYNYYRNKYFEACWKESISFKDIDSLEICECKNDELNDIIAELKTTNEKLHELLEKYIEKVRNHVPH